jgi:hypothetical protein
MSEIEIWHLVDIGILQILSPGGHGSLTFSCACDHTTDPNRIRSDFGTKIYILDRIGLIKLFRSRIGSDFDIRNKMN